MLASRVRNNVLILAASVGLAGCGTYFGNGIGVSMGYGSPYGYGYDDPYYSGYGYGSQYGYGSPYGYGYVPSYYGWYDNYYYPGTGRYVYDRNGTRQPWSEQQKRFWESRGAGVTTQGTTQTQSQTRTANWSDFRRAPSQVEVERSREASRRAIGIERSEQRRVVGVERSQQVRAEAAVRQQARVERQQARVERQQQRLERQLSNRGASDEREE